MIRIMHRPGVTFMVPSMVVGLVMVGTVLAGLPRVMARSQDPASTPRAHSWRFGVIGEVLVDVHAEGEGLVMNLWDRRGALLASHDIPLMATSAYDLVEADDGQTAWVFGSSKGLGDIASVSVSENGVGPPIGTGLRCRPDWLEAVKADAGRSWVRLGMRQDPDNQEVRTIDLGVSDDVIDIGFVGSSGHILVGTAVSLASEKRDRVAWLELDRDHRLSLRCSEREDRGAGTAHVWNRPVFDHEEDSVGVGLRGAGDVDDDGVEDLLLFGPNWGIPPSGIGGVILISGRDGATMSVLSNQKHSGFGRCASMLSDRQVCVLDGAAAEGMILRVYALRGGEWHYLMTRDCADVGLTKPLSMFRSGDGVFLVGLDDDDGLQVAYMALTR